MLASEATDSRKTSSGAFAQMKGTAMHRTGGYFLFPDPDLQVDSEIIKLDYSLFRMRGGEWWLVNRLSRERQTFESREQAIEWLGQQIPGFGENVKRIFRESDEAHSKAASQILTGLAELFRTKIKAP